MKDFRGTLAQLLVRGFHGGVLNYWIVLGVQWGVLSATRLGFSSEYPEHQASISSRAALTSATAGGFGPINLSCSNSGCFFVSGFSGILITSCGRQKCVRRRRRRKTVKLLTLPQPEDSPISPRSHGFGNQLRQRLMRRNQRSAFLRRPIFMDLIPSSALLVFCRWAS